MREYVLRLIEADLGRKDTWEVTREKLRSLPAPRPAGPTVVEIIREGREEREAQILDAVLRR